MMQSRILIAAAIAGVGILFTVPVTTATPLIPTGSPSLTTIAEQSRGIEQVARRYYRHRYGYRYPRYWRHRYGRCWNCGYRHYGYGAPFFLSFGFPAYGGYYGYPAYDGYYGHPYYGGYYGYPRYYRYRDPVWYGGKIN
jgi:hypothetical protein